MIMYFNEFIICMRMFRFLWLNRLFILVWFFIYFFKVDFGCIMVLSSFLKKKFYYLFIIYFVKK